MFSLKSINPKNLTTKQQLEDIPMSEKTITPFSQTLSFLEKGCLDAELTEQLAEVIKGVRETGKQGTVTMQLKVSLMKGTEDTVTIQSTVNNKVPQLDRAQTIMWSTYDGDLIRSDPSQQNLDLRSVETSNPTAPLKSAVGQN
jgi:ribosomal protein S28E/S33